MIEFDADTISPADYNWSMEFIDLAPETFTDEVRLEHKAWQFVIGTD